MGVHWVRALLQLLLPPLQPRQQVLRLRQTLAEQVKSNFLGTLQKRQSDKFWTDGSNFIHGFKPNCRKLLWLFGESYKSCRLISHVLGSLWECTGCVHY